jgi:hypothetical protein
MKQMAQKKMDSYIKYSLSVDNKLFNITQYLFMVSTVNYYISKIRVLFQKKVRFDFNIFVKIKSKY